MPNNDKKKVKKKRPWWKRGLRILSWIAITLFIIFILLVLFVRSPWGQDIIISKLTKFVSGKTHTEVSIKKLFITFSGDIYLEGLYLEDTKGDTLIYSKSLQAGIPLWPIIRGNPISIDGLEWNGLRANVIRKDSIEGYNFQFLIDAFASDSTATKPEKAKSKPLKISLGTMDFSDFRLNFDDAVLGMKANLNLGNLHIEGKEIDLEKMKFEVAELSIKNTIASFEQTTVMPPSKPKEPSESPLPILSVDHLELKNVIAQYKSIPDSMVANANIFYLGLEVPKVNLVNQNIEVGDITLNNSVMAFKMQAQKKVEPKAGEYSTTTEKSEPFNWPDWNIRAESITLQNNHLRFQQGEKPKDLQSFKTSYIDVTNFNLKANDIALLRDQSAQIKLNELSFNESGGLVLNQLTLNAALSSTSVAANDLVFKTGNSSLNANIDAQFTSIQGFFDNPNESQLTLNMDYFGIDLNDVFAFQPELKENEYLEKLSKHKITGQIDANGTLSDINLSELFVNWGQNTAIKTHGELKNLTDFDKFIMDIDNFTLYSTRSDIVSIISEEDLGISIPQTLLLQSQFQGGLDDLKTQTQLTIPEGKIKVNGQFKNKEEIAFNAKINVIDFKLGKLLKNPNIGTVAFEMNTSGKGNTINELNAELTSEFSKLEFNGYDFSALHLDGQLDNGKGDVTLNYKDDNLNLDIDSKIQLDSVSPKIDLVFNLDGADLQALGLTEKDIKAKLMMIAHFKGNTEEFDFDSHFSEGVIVYEKDNYYLGTLDMDASVRKDSIAMDISSNFLNGKLRANAGIDRTSNAIRQQMVSYFSDSIAPLDSIASLDSIGKPVKLHMNMKLSDTKLLTGFLVPKIKVMDTLVLSIDFDQEDKILTANLSLPYLDYADKTIDSLQFNLNSTEDAAKFKLGFNKLNAGPFVMNQTYFDGDLKDDLLRLHFHAFDGEKETYVIRTEVSGNKSDLKIHFDSKELVFHGEAWSVPSDNLINIQKDKITAQNFVLTRNDQSLRIANDLMETTQNNIGIGFTNFKLANLLALFNKVDLLASGDLQGNIVAIDPLGNFGLNADFSIDNLTALKAPFGKLTLLAKSKNGDSYNLDLGIKGDDIDLAIKGDYSLQNSGSELNFNVNLNKIGMKTIATISGENLKDASGDISGKVAVRGSVSSPDYKGYLQFNDAVFNVSQLNSKFRLANNKIEIDNTDITLNKFSIEDDQKNKFILNGSILTEDFSDPEFDLSVNAKNFQALNSTEKDNELFYGDVNFDMDGTIKGKLSYPKVNMNIGINESTDFTYVIQNSQAKLEKRDGIVEFVNIENPDNILTRANDSNIVVSLGNMELHAKLNIDKGANFNVIIDPQTGDNLNISGAGALDFNMGNNGRMTLSGRYEISKGHYSLSLYNLVKRKFEIESGSSVTWRGGGPLDADLNVTAKYEVKTSASGLMASQTAGASEEVKNKYRQKLPFWVFLNVKGELDQPKLDFLLGMPEDSRGAIDGTVYSRIKQLNTDEDELNKQVFSLLVLKKFYPNPGSDGSNGGVASIARDNLNDALTDQLNVFSDKLLGNTGVELNFGLNSYTDYQGESADQRTDLNVTAQKKLLDDRLIVQVGSTVNVQGDSNPGEENQIMGNASIQYLLTEDGRWRLKGFRDSEYENVIDGQVYVNGISIIFQRQFNKLSELFRKPPKVEEDSTEDTDDD